MFAQAAQRCGTLTSPGIILKMWYIRTWFSAGLDHIRFMVRFNYLKGLFQSKWFYDSIINNICKLLRGGCKEDGAMPFSLVPCDRTRCKTRSFHSVLTPTWIEREMGQDGWGRVRWCRAGCEGKGTKIIKNYQTPLLIYSFTCILGMLHLSSLSRYLQ